MTWKLVQRVFEQDGRGRNVGAYSASTRIHSDGFALRDSQISAGEHCSKPAHDDNAIMRLYVVTERAGTPVELRRSVARPSPKVAYPVAFAPAEMQPVMYSEGGGQYRIGVLVFDADAIERKLTEHIDRSLLLEPKLCFTNERMHWLSRQLLSETAAASELSGLYADSALVMLLVELLRAMRADDHRASGLRPKQLARVTEYIEHNLDSQVRLADLAALTGLSVSFFCQAFRASTGVPPHRWQMQERIKKAQRLMLLRDQPLMEIARTTGFADQSHFTRTFRRLEGVTPARWLREHAARATLHDLGKLTKL